MNNLDRYYDESHKYEDNRKCFFFQKRTGLPCCGDDTYNCKHCFENTIKWLLRDCEGLILTEEEKEYLRNDIKICGNKFKHIEKQCCGDYARIENPKYPSHVTAGVYFFTTHDLQFAGLGFNIYYILKELKL